MCLLFPGSDAPPVLLSEGLMTVAAFQQGHKLTDVFLTGRRRDQQLRADWLI